MEALEGSAGAPASGSAVTAPSYPDDMTMQGNLKQIALPEVLQFISMGKSTGLLTVKDPAGIQTTLAIRQGRIVNSSALERQRRLGDLLVQRGFLRRSVLAQVLNVQRAVETDRRIGEILLERDLIQESQIREVLRLQLEEEIWNLFALDEGEFRFEQVGEDKLGEPIVQIDIEPLLLEGTRRQDEWRQINRILPTDRLVIAVKPMPHGADTPRLTSAEWRVFSQINGRFSIRGLINRTGMGRFEVSKIIVELLHKGIIDIKDEANIQGEVLAQLEDAQRELNAPTPIAARGMSGLFSKLRGASARREDQHETREFATPTGALAYIVNRMIEEFLSLRDKGASPQDASLITHLWSDIVVTFTKADLIVVERNLINAEKLEEFFRLCEFADSVQDCFEDSVEGLLQLLEALYRIFSQRKGERTAARMAREILDETLPRIRLLYGAEYNLSERVQMVLRLAA